MSHASFDSPDLKRFLREQEEIPDKIEAKCERHYQAACAHLIPVLSGTGDLPGAVAAFYQTVQSGKPLDFPGEGQDNGYCPDADSVLFLAGDRWRSWWHVSRDLRDGRYNRRAFVSDLYAVCLRWNVESYAKYRTMKFLKSLSAVGVEEKNTVTNRYWDCLGKFYAEDCLFHIKLVREYDYRAVFLGHPELVSRLRGRTRRLCEPMDAEAPGSSALEG